MSKREITFYMLGFEGGAGTRGASLGPAALKIADLDAGSKLFKRFPTYEIPLSFDYLYEKNVFKCANRIDAVLTFSNAVLKLIEENYEADRHLPIFIGGDHSITASTITGILKKKRDARIGVIWIDAHADLHSPYTTPSGNVHGMVLGSLLGESHIHLKKNEPSEEEIKLWNEWVMLGGFPHKIRWTDIVYVGLRSMEPEEKILIDTHAVKIYSVNDFETKGADRIATEIMIYFSQCSHIYISFDVDVIDPLVSRGTGTPVPHGMRPHVIRDFLVRFITHPKLIGMDIVEINPTFDFENVMAEYVHEIIQSLVNIVEYW